LGQQCYAGISFGRPGGTLPALEPELRRTSQRQAQVCANHRWKADLALEFLDETHRLTRRLEISTPEAIE